MSGNQVWSRRLKEAREAIGLSQKQLGIEAGLDPSVASTRINRYELGVHKADYQISQKLAEVLKVPVAYLYADDDALAEIIRWYGQADAGQRERLMKVMAGPA
jgi:transcriptional regulator with XRE-family HTH domain